MRSNLVTVALLGVLLLLYTAYSGLYVNPTHPAYSQLFAPRPKDFSAVEEFLQKPELQASKYDAAYRYMILPSYVQINAYARYNYPNFLYFSSFSSEEVSEFVMATNELMAEQDMGAIFPLSLASIKYIAILPESFARDELQAWRLQGKTRASGPHLFGDINEYVTFVSGLPDTQLLYESNVSVFVNERVVPRVYVPETLVLARGDIGDVFRGLRVVDRAFPLSNFVLTTDQSECAESLSFVVEDFSKQMRTKAGIFNLTRLSCSYASEEEVTTIDENSILVWSQEKTLCTEGDSITVRATVPAGQQILSEWIKIPPTNLTGRPKVRIGLIASNDMWNKMSFSVLDLEGRVLPARIEKTMSSAAENDTCIDVLITPLSSVPAWIKVVLQGTPGESVEMVLEKWVRFEKLVGLELYLDGAVGVDLDEEDEVTFPVVINGSENVSVLWPASVEDGVVRYAVSKPVELDKALVLAVSSRRSDGGWLKVNDDVEWLSPVNISVDVEISLLGGEGDEILVPLFFGNAYDASWRLRASTSSGAISGIEHAVGNGFGNLWLVRVSGIDDVEGSLGLSLRIEMDKFHLYLHQIYMASGVMLLLFAVPLCVLWVRRDRLS